MYGNPLDESVTMTSPRDIVSDSAFHQITELVNHFARDNNEHWSSLYHEDLKNAVEDQWLITRGTYAGTFPKRIRSFLIKVHGLKITPELMSEIGNIARASMTDVPEFKVHFTKTRWHDGTYGDHGSCFWGGRSRALDMIFDNDGGAVCIHLPNGNPRARCWYIQSGDYYALFNSYSTDNGFHLVKIARLLATHYGLSYAEVHLVNRGNDDGTLWINGGHGYLIGPADSINGWSVPRRDLIKTYDLEIEDHGSMMCISCDDYFHEDQIRMGLDGCYYCDDCFNENYAVCDWCGGTHPNDDMTYVSDIYENLCPRCTERRAFYCVDCSEFYSTDHGPHYVRDHGDVCESCRDHHYYCVHCGEMTTEECQCEAVTDGT